MTSLVALGVIWRSTNRALGGRFQRVAGAISNPWLFLQRSCWKRQLLLDLIRKSPDHVGAPHVAKPIPHLDHDVDDHK